MSQSPRTEQPLPAHYAFVVQFGTETDVARERFVGRVEHVLSGRATHFRTLEEWVAFVGGVLRELGTLPPREV